MSIREHQRKSNRLKGYDYSQDGWYFITICTRNRKELFGQIENNKMILNNIGEIALQCWTEIPQHFPDVVLDEFVIMPNHIHGIIIIQSTVGNKNFCSLQKEQLWQMKLSRSLSSVIRGFKIGISKRCWENNLGFHWQKSFYDHIIRNEKSLYLIRRYIQENPLKWEQDKNNKGNLYC